MDANLVADWWWTVWFDILFTTSQLPNLHPCGRMHATKCVQLTIALLYQHKLFELFLFYVIEFCDVVIFKPWTQYVWLKSGILFFSWHAQLPLGLWLPTLQCEWINILLRTPSIWFLLDRNALRFSLHLAESVVRQIQKTKRSVIVHFFYLLLVGLFLLNVGLRAGGIDWCITGNCFRVVRIVLKITFLKLRYPGQRP